MVDLKLYELYYLILVDHIHNDNLIPYDMELIWHKINDYYFKECNVKLDINSEKDCITLFNWLRNKTRYELLDHLMLQMVNRFINLEDVNGDTIDNRDEFFINNLDTIYDILSIQAKTIIDKINIDEKELPKLTKEETIDIVKDILMEIDPNGDWVTLYEDAIRNKKILYLNEITLEDEARIKRLIGIDSLKHIDNSYLQVGKNDGYLFLRYNGDIGDIPPTVHEVVHYIIRKYSNGKTEAPILREFPSIFYELYAINYLEKLGYDREILDVINYDRLIDSYLSLKDMNNMLFYLYLMLSNNKIDMENDKKLYEEMLNNAEILLKESIYDKDNDYTNRCDQVTCDLITNPYLLFQIYPYIVGNYLADQGINKISVDKTLFSIIKYITENLTSVSVYDVFSLLSDNLDYIDNKEKVKVRDK